MSRSKDYALEWGYQKKQEGGYSGPIISIDPTIWEDFGGSCSMELDYKRNNHLLEKMRIVFVDRHDMLEWINGLHDFITRSVGGWRKVEK